MKKIILAIILSVLLMAPVQAQTNTEFITDQTILQEQYRSLLRQLIDLLLQQVAQLQAQLAELQTQQAESSLVVAQQSQDIQKIQEKSKLETNTKVQAEQSKTDKRKRYSELQKIFLQVSPYQQDRCRNDWLTLKKTRLNIDVFTSEGMAMASSTGRFADSYEDSTYADCLNPNSTRYKTAEQQQAYEELKRLEVEIN